GPGKSSVRESEGTPRAAARREREELMSERESANRIAALGRTLIRLRVPVLFGVALVSGFFAFHASKLELMSRFDELLPATHPYVAVHKKFAKSFGGANTVLLMIRVRDGDIFNIPTLNKIWALTQELDRIYGVNHYQIESLAHRTNR